MKTVSKFAVTSLLVTAVFAVAALVSTQNAFAATPGTEKTVSGTLTRANNANGYYVNGVYMNLYGVDSLVGSSVNANVRYDAPNHFDVTSITKQDGSATYNPTYVNNYYGYTNSYRGKLVTVEENDNGYTHTLEGVNINFKFDNETVKDLNDKDVVVTVRRNYTDWTKFTVVSVVEAGEYDSSMDYNNNYNGYTRTFTGKLIESDGHTSYKLEGMNINLNGNYGDKVGQTVDVTVQYTGYGNNFRVVSVK